MKASIIAILVGVLLGLGVSWEIKREEPLTAWTNILIPTEDGQVFQLGLKSNHTFTWREIEVAQ